MITTWFAFQSTPQREFKAAAHLQSYGFRTCVPIEMRWRRTDRYSRRREQFEYPMFVGYVFAGTDAHPVNWMQIMTHTDGRGRRLIRGVVAADGAPARISQDAMLDLMALSGKTVDSRLPNPRKSFQAGDLVIITSDGFAGHPVRIKAIENGKATVFLSLFNATREINMPLENLEAA